MLFRQLIDVATGSLSYLIADPYTKEAAIVDPVRNRFDRDLSLIQQLDLKLKYVLETHLHDDHVSAAALLREALGARVAVPEGSDIKGADHYIKDRERLPLGDVLVEALATPGHTMAHMAYYVNHDRVLTGDALWVRSSGRITEQDGDAMLLWHSVHQRVFVLGDDVRVYPGHDKQGHLMSTVGEEKHFNTRFVSRNSDQFVAFMHQLDMPAPSHAQDVLLLNRCCGAEPLVDAAH